MSNYNVLLVEDNAGVCEIISLILASEFPVNLSMANSEQGAVDKLSANAKFDLIVSDINMPNKDSRVLFNYLTHNKIKTPLMLITNDKLGSAVDFKSGAYLSYLEKPFNESSVFDAVSKFLKKEEAEGPTEDNNYVAISIITMKKIGRIESPLFIKLSDQKFIKLYNTDINFNEMEYSKLKKRDVEFLYVERKQFRNLIRKYKSKVLSEMFYAGVKSNIREGFTTSLVVQEMVKKSIQAFGFSDDAIKLAEQNIKFVKAVTDKYDNLNSFLRWLKMDNISYNYRYEYMQSVLICHLVAAIAQRYQFQNPNALDILSLSAFFHDISLDIYLMKNEPSFREAIKRGSKINRSDLENIRLHPMKSSQMLNEWQLCPREVQAVIEAHCELPDGSGFPMGLKADRLSELSSCFIICENVISRFLQSRKRSDLIDYLKRSKEFYSAGLFGGFYEIILDLLKQEVE
jgi:response regulator RpfG family c-di-GMP phosphodiesterase